MKYNCMFFVNTSLLTFVSRYCNNVCTCIYLHYISKLLKDKKVIPKLCFHEESVSIPSLYTQKMSDCINLENGYQKNEVGNEINWKSH